MMLTNDFKDARLAAIKDESVTEYPIEGADLVLVMECAVCGYDVMPELITQVRVGDVTVFSTVVCKRCLYVWRAVSPSEEWFQRCAEQLAAKTTARGSVSNLAADAMDDVRDKAYGKRAQFVSRYVKDKTMLDVGAAFGTGMGVFRKLGYQVAGIEPDPTRCAGGNVYNGTLQGALANGYDQRHGLVMLCHVLEHCRDPLFILQNLHKMLKPGGVAYVEVPSCGIINWSDAFYLAHMSNFTVTSFTRLVQRANSHLGVLDMRAFIHEGGRVDLGFILGAGPKTNVNLPSRPDTNYVKALYRVGLPATLVRNGGPLKYRVPRIDHYNYGLRFNRYTPRWAGEFIEFTEDRCG